MYGWRSRIGIIVPSANASMEPEMWRMAPEGVSIYASRMLATGCSIEDLKAQDAFVETCAQELGTTYLNIIVFGCTSGSFFGGPDQDSEIRRRITKITNCPAITTTGAVLDALKVFGKKKLTIASPYVDEVANLETQFFSNEGYDVVSHKNMGFDRGIDIFSQQPGDTYRLARAAVVPETEILFISCTNLRTIESLEVLEQDLGIPVISSNQCSMWAALRATHVNQKIGGWGSLMSI
jgi:maleate isomerase